MSIIKKANVAGQFYPDNQQELSNMLKAFLGKDNQGYKFCPKALIVPHAGYIYSGAVAGFAYTKLFTIKDIIKQVIIFAPAHFFPFTGIATSSVDYFQTPLGDVKVNRDTLAKIADLTNIQILEQAYKGEHSLEVQLPFLQYILKEFTITPLLIGSINYNAIATIMNLLWGDDSTLFIISSDLSHYHPYETAKKIDKETSQAILTKDIAAIKEGSACGRLAIQALLAVAIKKKLQIDLVDLRNSGDTSGSKDRVVGYGSYIIG
ncbi:MAG: AmmeMemoRadiSam system protein B [Rickettsiaceae bacterium]|nr:AmmeMemoRadiSam system protein B [Rickettsiaceae bacterium]